MSKSKLEYIWLDGGHPTQNLRGKTRVETDFSGKLKDCPMWAFDGSSTQQAEGNASDCLLKPVAIFPDPGRHNSFLVMTEVLNADGTPHVSNGRATIEDDDDDFWFGFEQEYFLWENGEWSRLFGNRGDASSFGCAGDPYVLRGVQGRPGLGASGCGRDGCCAGHYSHSAGTGARRPDGPPSRAEPPPRRPDCRDRRSSDLHDVS